MAVLNVTAPLAGSPIPSSMVALRAADPRAATIQTDRNNNVFMLNTKYLLVFSKTKMIIQMQKV